MNLRRLLKVEKVTVKALFLTLSQLMYTLQALKFPGKYIRPVGVDVTC